MSSTENESTWPPKEKAEPFKKPKVKDRPFRTEADLSTAIIKKFNSLKNVRCQKVKGSAYGLPTLDIVGSRHGMFFWLEVKQPGGKPTTRQKYTMKRWIEDGAIASWTDSVEGAMKFLLSDWRQLTETKMMEGFHAD